MSASSLSLPIFLRINFLISYLDSNRLTEHIRLTHTESFAEWQKAGAGCTSRAFKHPGHDVTAPDVWPSILTDYTYDSELDNADGIPLAFQRSSMFPEGNIHQQYITIFYMKFKNVHPTIHSFSQISKMFKQKTSVQSTFIITLYACNLLKSNCHSSRSVSGLSYSNNLKSAS